MIIGRYTKAVLTIIAVALTLLVACAGPWKAPGGSQEQAARDEYECHSAAAKLHPAPARVVTTNLGALMGQPHIKQQKHAFELCMKARGYTR